MGTFYQLPISIELNLLYLHENVTNFKTSPTVQFTTADGKEITGKPITGFISQTEITAPFDVYVYYNVGNPEEFYVEF